MTNKTISPPSKYDIESYIAAQPEDLRPHFEEIYALPPRILPIVVAAFLDEYLADLLKARLIESKQSSQLVDRLNTKQRTELGQVIGVIAPDIAEVLDCVATVRNHFAHTPNPKFTDDKACEAMQRMFKLFIGQLGTRMGLPKDRLEDVKKASAAILRTDEEDMRLWLISMYTILRMFLKDVTGVTKRVDLAYWSLVQDQYKV